jgi:hypothetical protein
LSSRNYSDSWTGYDAILQNGDFGSLQQLEEKYDRGQIGERNTTGIILEKTFDMGEIQQVNPEEEVLEDERKILYTHPSEVTYPAGTTVGIQYSGSSTVGHSGKKVTDSAIMMVQNKPPIENIENLEQVRNFLIGDREDQCLEGKGIRVQVYPFTV